MALYEVLIDKQINTCKGHTLEKIFYKPSPGEEVFLFYGEWPTFPDGNPVQNRLCKKDENIIRAKTQAELDAEAAARPKTIEERLSIIEALLKTK